CENTSVMLSIKPIAYIHSDFSEKFGIPRQSGLGDSLQAKIIFTEEFRNGDCISGIDEFSHLWLIWECSKNQRDKWTPTVRPPRLCGNKRKGVFASRAPFRPNQLGITCV
ncbi:tRNA (N6-threonylcarbamoyladenosine(37)-N6)-methyltransferase TrmO, partial [Anaerobutyricum hallii]|uniref:tRNA (N6-threonylcarbamoyladenosine(37)-N6)-methyltransferase TrmO n=1 Tax=Anaerobutyricum hallii TaxID=39488 RepID=UPI001ADD9DEF|nr:tRNA (N6-threonylcarbamoyladenosine(37)-N6)-methyltransferase TrmO [Anaerobutyricum hallii]